QQGAVGFDITITDRDTGDDARKRKVWQNYGEIGEAWSTMDDCGTITLIDQAAGTVPQAFAGLNQTVLSGSTVTLSGNGFSAISGSNLSYQWISPSDIALDAVNSKVASFIAPNVDQPSTFVFGLSTNDGQQNSDISWVMVTVRGSNARPIAVADGPALVKGGDVVILSASGSYDPDNDNITYQWESLDNIEVNSAKSAQPSFTAPEVDVVTVVSFKLTVFDGFDVSEPAIVQVAVQKRIGVDTWAQSIKPKVYPNPANNQLFVDLDNSSVANLEFYTFSGKKLKSYVLKENKNTIDLLDFKNGIYLLKIANDRGVYFEQIIINK
ncbi:MAG: T9SS type A sorting domain-containing protein, partial [Prolixibacteraceae bacterium]|nr:T9SS type A sorting domain-containing protein [Prolixibacteraceae bacterium]